MSDAINPTPVTSVRVQRWINRQARLRTGVLTSSADAMIKAMPRHIRNLFQGQTSDTFSAFERRLVMKLPGGWHTREREKARRVRNGEAKPAAPRQSSVW
jgi:hypothetical protein